MTHDDLANALFPGGHALEDAGHGALKGHGISAAGTRVGVVGIANGEPIGVEVALILSGLVLDHVAQGGAVPLLVLVDTASQRMTRRDELLGLNECLAHLSKSLALASMDGHPTIGLMHGGAAAGAFIATALSTDRLVAVPGAEPSVMDLPSIARVTKLPLDRLQEMAASTPIFAPGLDPLAATGAVLECWDDYHSRYAAMLDALLEAGRIERDERDRLGQQRQGRKRAAEVARLVEAQVLNWASARS